nr:RNA-dependent RNA polymerase [Flumine sobemo-like virus 20]
MERFELLFEAGDLSSCTAEELVKGMYVDPVRIFVKNEPHSLAKLAQCRVRLIMSVSIVDQLVERLLHEDQNAAEIAHWSSIPSKPGMGLDDNGISLLVADVIRRWPELDMAEADISGFDWSVQDWELLSDAQRRSLLSGSDKDMARMLERTTQCLKSVYALSNGVLIAQKYLAVQKSGRYSTSASNSYIKTQAAKLIGAEKAISMGDDGLESYVERAVEKYAALGHDLKSYTQCSGGAFEFCSNKFAHNVAVPLNWSKTLYRLLCHKQTTVDVLGLEFLGQFKYECRYLPTLGNVLGLLERVGWGPIKREC